MLSTFPLERLSSGKTWLLATKVRGSGSGSPGLVVMEETHVQEVVGANLGTGCTFFICIVVKMVVCLKKSKINDKKRPGVAHLKKSC